VPGAEVDIIPNCGHLLHIEKAELVANKVLAFVNGKARGTP
jgi:pimeloyl-ACP methyl ester carboxylesterase